MLELINVDTDPIYPIPVIHEGIKEEKKKRGIKRSDFKTRDNKLLLLNFF